MHTAKEVAREVLNSLPDDCTLDDISYRLYLWRKLEKSGKDIEEGRVFSKDEAKEIVQSWFTSSGLTKPSAT
jgi:hypothetical protein